MEAEISIEAGPSVVYDAIVLPSGAAAQTLAANGAAVEFVKDAYRHCKAMLVLGGGESPILAKAGITETLPDGSPEFGMVQRVGNGISGVDAFVIGHSAHRNFARETDPPRV